MKLKLILSAALMAGVLSVQAVPATADYHCIVGGLRIRAPPLLAPPSVP